MTTRDNRGGRRVPDGQPRPKPVPMGSGPNRQDLAQLPGTPGTELPQGIDEGIPFGSVGPTRNALADLPISAANTSQTGLLAPGTQMPDQPVTAGIDMGAGPGSESLMQPPDMMSNQFAGRQLATLYPVVMRLATLPNATTQTKILAQKLRTMLPKKPEQLRKPPNGNYRPT